GPHTSEQVSSTRAELDTLTTEYEQIQSRIREASPRYAALTLAVPLNVSEIRENVLDEDTMLLEYAVGQNHSYVFALTRSSLDAYELPRRAMLEPAVRRVYGLLTARNMVVANETADEKMARVRRAGGQYAAAATRLSRMLLGPV